MKVKRELIAKLIRKAKQSICHIRVSALGFNQSGDLVASSTNSPYKNGKGKGLHAEQVLFSQAKRKGIVRIIICRIGKGGNLLPIDPCKKCATIADKMGIRIDTVPMEV